MNQNKRQRTKKEKKQTLGTEQNARFEKKKISERREGKGTNGAVS